jgi:hypothetical protein
MTDYYLARQRLEYALQELDGDGTPHERLTQAWVRLVDLGLGDVTVPPSIASGVAAMHATVGRWVLPRRTDALGTAVSWLDDGDCLAAIELIQSWRHAVDDAIGHGSSWRQGT